MTDLRTSDPHVTDRPIGLAEIARVFMAIGTSYGGPAIVGIMQAEVQEKRQWLSKQQFVEGLALVNMLPGPPAAQLAIFIGHAKAGLPGGIMAGLCFVLPAFLIMLVLAAVYMAFGTLPAMRSAFYGIGPVVVGIFAASILRLGRGTIKERVQVMIAIATAVVVLLTPVGLATALLAAGCIGIMLFHARRAGAIALVVLAAAVAAYCLIDTLVAPSTMAAAGVAPQADSEAPGLWQLATLFLKVGVLTFGGGLSLLAFIQQQVVNQLGWLTPAQFIDALALGQLTPGPILMFAAFVGFKFAGVTGAAVTAGAIFLPSFVMMLSILPVLRKFEDVGWLKAFMRGVAPAVVGALVVALVHMAPAAAPDPFAWGLLVLTFALVLLRPKVGAFPLVVGGAAIGLIGERIAKFAW